jgi:hypothetical protein
MVFAGAMNVRDRWALRTRFCTFMRIFFSLIKNSTTGEQLAELRSRELAV